ncbi:MAG: hypothetical protein NUV77_09595 [Thermoguttaceae bacterium]|jgi:hypothetical protein|nr:hypothetical protein [Thermoguttaceae bacterium]
MTELRTILATYEHLLTADVPTNGQRLLDTLNDRTSDFLRVTNVQLVQRDGTGCVASVPAAAIRKAQIGLAIPASESHEARDKRLACFVQKKEYEAILLVLGYVVRGRLQLRDTDDPVVALCHELQTFFPIPHASVSLPGVPDDVRTKVVLVNSSFVSFFHFDAPVRGRA